MNNDLQKEFLKWLVIKKPDMVMEAVFGKQAESKYKTGDVMEDGYIYVGFISTDKERYHLAINTRAEGEFTWKSAMDKFGDSVPTSRELSMVFAQGLLKESNVYHWSSREYNNTNAYIQRFSDGIQTTRYKNITYLVRCVRRFGYEKI